MAVFDKSGMYEIIENLYEQVERGYEFSKQVSINTPISNIIIAAVGGSAIPGYILKQYLKNSKIPVFVIEDYKLPNFAGRESLVFVISYSGDAEETVSMYRDALKKECNIITIGAGGKLREISSLSRTTHILVPKEIPTRLAYPYLFFPMLRILENSKIIPEQKEFVKRVVKILKHNKFEDITESISGKIMGKIPIIYASTSYEVVARKWKLNFNENTEIPAFFNTFPSATHNEIAYFLRNNSQFYVLIIKSEEDEQMLKRRSLIVKDVLRETGVPVTEIGVTGDCYLVRLFSAMLIGDWLSYNLAIKIGVDPSPTRVIAEIKKRMQS